MGAPAVSAELMLDAIKARLDLIVGAPDFNTSPTVAIGVPRDAIAEGAGELVFVTHSSSETIFDATGTHHTERAIYFLWCVSGNAADSYRKALRLVRDVQKALRSGFGALEVAAANAGVALGGYVRDHEAEEKTGATVYALTLTADWVVDLNS